MIKELGTDIDSGFELTSEELLFLEALPARPGAVVLVRRLMGGLYEPKPHAFFPHGQSEAKRALRSNTLWPCQQLMLLMTPAGNWELVEATDNSDEERNGTGYPLTANTQ